LEPSFTVGNELHIHEWFKLNVSSWLVSVQVQLVRGIKALAADFYEVVVVTFGICFELDVQLDRETGGNTADVLKVATEVRSFRL
jgi:hypothetical protein